MIDSVTTLTDAPWKEVLQFAVTLIAILNPVAGASIFLTMVGQKSKVKKIQIARKAAVSIFIILLTVIWFGDTVLNIFGISVPAFRVGGGIITLYIGLDMLEFIRLCATADTSSKNKDIAVVPLAIPIIAGPGVIAVTLTEMHNTFDTIREKIIVSLTSIFVVILIWLSLRFASSFEKKLGPIGLDILTKLMGLVLVIIATQMVLEGLIGVFPALVKG